MARIVSVLKVQLNILLYLFYIINGIGLSKVYPFLNNLRQRSLLGQTSIRPVDSHKFMRLTSGKRYQLKILHQGSFMVKRLDSLLRITLNSPSSILGTF